MDIPPIPAAQSFPEALETGGVKRVTSLKDRVWFKLKTTRWRGAVVRLTDSDLAAEDGASLHPLSATSRWWLAAVGIREEGAQRDFYRKITSASSCPKTPQKPDGIDTDYLLPSAWDRKRVAAEHAYAQRIVFERFMLEAAAKSLRSGKVITAKFALFSIGLVIRADRGEQYVAFIAENVFDPRALAAMMDAFPGMSASDWAPEPNQAFGMNPKIGQIIYSAPLPTDVADSILDADPWTED
ncbi:hypothetical protein [Branchiibius hedensis]|uniref:hypothetical protein n=1 Tax=Branchiibius hedensis TaxID=672460 RepID=UPI000D6B6A6E|nr:hypothetical protein [Branchiibius hedensis]